MLERTPLLKVGPEVEAAHRHLTVQLVLQARPPMSKVRLEVEAARRYLTVQALLRGRSSLLQMRSALQADLLELELGMPRELRETRRQT